MKGFPRTDDWIRVNNLYHKETLYIFWELVVDEIVIEKVFIFQTFEYSFEAPNIFECFL